MQATVILDCRLISHDSADNDSHPSINMKGNCASIAASVIKVRSYTVYSTRSHSGATVETPYAVRDSVGSGDKMVENGAKTQSPTLEIMQNFFEITVVGEAMLKWSHNSTLYCTLSHRTTPF